MKLHNFPRQVAGNMPENKRLFPPKFPVPFFKLSRSPLFLPDCMRKRTKPNEQIKSGSPHITSKRYTSLKGTSVSKGNARNNKQKDNTPIRLPAIFGTVPFPCPKYGIPDGRNYHFVRKDIRTGVLIASATFSSAIIPFQANIQKNKKLESEGGSIPPSRE